MKVLGHRFCFVGEKPFALDMSKSFAALGLPIGQAFTANMQAGDALSDEDFAGAIFPVSGESWIEVWSEIPGVPKGVMLQIIVDDADAFAEHARQNGLSPEGPVESHGEKIYYIVQKCGLPVSFQSKTASGA